MLALNGDAKVEIDDMEDVDEERETVPTEDKVSAEGMATRCSFKSLKSSDRNFCHASPSEITSVLAGHEREKVGTVTYWMARSS